MKEDPRQLEQHALESERRRIACIQAVRDFIDLEYEHLFPPRELLAITFHVSMGLEWRMELHPGWVPVMLKKLAALEKAMQEAKQTPMEEKSASEEPQSEAKTARRQESDLPVDDKTCANSILAFLSQASGKQSLSQLLGALPQFNKSTVKVVAQQLVQAGKLVQDHNRYFSLPPEPVLPSARLSTP